MQEAPTPDANLNGSQAKQACKEAAKKTTRTGQCRTTIPEGVMGMLLSDKAQTPCSGMQPHRQCVPRSAAAVPYPTDALMNTGKEGRGAGKWSLQWGDRPEGANSERIPNIQVATCPQVRLSGLKQGLPFEVFQPLLDDGHTQH